MRFRNRLQKLHLPDYRKALILHEAPPKHIRLSVFLMVRRSFCMVICGNHTQNQSAPPSTAKAPTFTHLALPFTCCVSGETMRETQRVSRSAGQTPPLNSTVNYPHL